MRLSEAGEAGLLRELERRGLVRGLDAEGPVLAEGRVATVDVLMEGVHFCRKWASWRDVGYKAAAVNLSDLAAMGAEPEALAVALAVPAETEVDAIVELYEGLGEPGVAVSGGDLAVAERAVVGVTAFGRSERIPGRGGARAGDALVVTGPLGGSAAGLHALENELEGFDDLVRAHLRPPLRLTDGRRLAPVAHAMIDLSDGILRDAARIAERSGCRVVVDVQSLPMPPRIAEVADRPFWTMGEDYELLAALLPADAEASGFPVVGRCEEGEGVAPSGPLGWDSFSRAADQVRRRR